MISPLAQLIIIAGKLPGQPDPKKITAEAPPQYRPYCPDCNDEGRDARLPCEGHN